MERRNRFRADQATRFKKGVSGNPKGRPKGKKKNIADSDAFNVVLSDEIIVTTDGRERRMTVRELIVRRMAEKALKGDVPTAKLLLASAPAIAADQQAADLQARIAGAKETLRRKLSRLNEEVNAKKSTKAPR